MIVRVIDGDPRGEEIVSALEKISLQPEAALFKKPNDRSIQYIYPKDASKYVQEFSDFFGR
jgi:hypothetical protein